MNNLIIGSFSEWAQPMLAAQRLSIGTLMVLGAFGGLLIMSWSYSNWRAGVKVALVTALFEGAIRKWGFSSGQELIYFLKDVFLAGSYLRFYLSPDDAVRAKHLKMGLGFFALAAGVISFSALSPDIGSPLLAIFGLKIYLYYLPLIFMIPHLFKSEEDLKKNLLYYSLLATPICLLGIAQWLAPGSSFLNVYAQDNDNIIITTMSFSERVRITGTFSYLTGHVTFMVVFFSLHIGLLCTNIPKWAYLWLIGNIPLLLANAMMSGSRGIVVYMAFFVTVFFGASSFMQVSRSRSIAMVMLVVVALGGGLAVTVFREASVNWYIRATESGDTIKSRTVDHTWKSMGYAINEVGLLGYGVGMTHPAMERMRKVLNVAPPRVKPPVYDLEVSQVYVELGLFGFLSWYALRIFLVYHTYRAFMESRSELMKPLLLTSFLIQAPHLIFSFILNHTAGILVSAFAGLSLIPDLVSSRVAPRFAGRGDQTPPPAPETRGSLAPVPTRRGSRVRY